MAKTEKTKAELYREERKARIAKANKQNSKNIEKGKKIAGVGKKVVAVILCVAIIAGLGYWLNLTFGIVEGLATAAKVGNQKVSASDFHFYFSNMYQQAAYYEQMMSQQYGYSTGFDTSKSPDEIPYTDEDGKETTYAQYFKDEAIEQLQHLLAVYQEAEKNNFELDEDKLNEIDETIDNYKNSASENGFSLNAYLKASFGGGFTEKKFRKQLVIQETASAYEEKLHQDYTDGVKTDDILAKYKDGKKDYDYADIHYYKFAGEALTAEEGETEDALKERQDKENEKIYKEADAVYKDSKDVESLEKALKEYLDKKAEEEAAEAAKAAAESTPSTPTDAEEATATDTATATEAATDTDAATATDAEEEPEKENSSKLEASTYSSIKAAVGEKGADWVYADGRKAGDRKLIKDESNAYIIIVDKAPYQGNSVTVRHISVPALTDSDEEEPTAADLKKAKSDAEDILKEWKEGKKTEETFADLANAHSDDTATNTTGGLIEKLRINSSTFNDDVNDWAFDKARKAGDTKIFEKDDGYEIVYFVSNNKDDIDQYDAIRSELGNEAAEKFEEELLADDGEYAIDVNEYWTNKIMNDFCKTMKRNIAYQNR